MQTQFLARARARARATSRNSSRGRAQRCTRKLPVADAVGTAVYPRSLPCPPPIHPPTSPLSRWRWNTDGLRARPIGRKKKGQGSSVGVSDRLINFADPVRALIPRPSRSRAPHPTPPHPPPPLRALPGEPRRAGDITRVHVDGKQIYARARARSPRRSGSRPA